MLESIRNTFLVLSLIVLSFGLGNIFAFNEAQKSVEAQQKEFMQLYDTYHSNDIMLKCITIKFIIINDNVIACSLVDKKAQKIPSKMKTKKNEYKA